MKALAILLTAIFFLGTVTSTFAHKASITFSISNQQSIAIGGIKVSSATADFALDAPAGATTTVDVDATVISVTINSHVIPQGSKQYVTLASGTVVGVMWTSTNGIVIVEEGQIR